MNQVKLDAIEIKEMLSYIINNNRAIQAKGKTPVAVEITGESGLGKTAISLQLANELNLHHVKLNLSQIEELGDLVGFPIRQFEMQKYIISINKNEAGQMAKVRAKSGESVWVDENATVSYEKQGYLFTTNKRMSYCPPEWIADKKKGGILILDDYTRADLRFLQATMELCDKQEYISWKLPDDWHLILTSNPDNGEYLVNTIDKAQRTRFISVEMKWSVDRWAEWAEIDGIDNRCINFLLMNHDVVKDQVNPRSLTNFFNAITSIEDFNESLGLIQNLGEGSVGPEVATLFSSFIHNKMDKWITPKQILLDVDTAGVINRISDIFGVNGTYRADIASVITTRVINFALYYAETNPISQDIIDRLIKLIKVDNLFTDDLKYHVVKKLLAGNKQKFKMLVFDTEIQEIATK